MSWTPEIEGDEEEEEVLVGLVRDGEFEKAFSSDFSRPRVLAWKSSPD